jgi:hypothetical protein
MPILQFQKCLTQAALTAILTCREKLYDPVAQWIERLPAEEKAGGSSPLGIARAELAIKVNSAFFRFWMIPLFPLPLRKM